MTLPFPQPTACVVHFEAKDQELWLDGGSFLCVPMHPAWGILPHGLEDSLRSPLSEWWLCPYCPQTRNLGVIPSLPPSSHLLHPQGLPVLLPNNSVILAVFPPPPSSPFVPPSSRALSPVLRIKYSFS